MLSFVIILLPSEIAVIKTEAPVKRMGPKFQENALADHHARATGTESIKIVAYIHEVFCFYQKYNPLLPDIALQRSSILLLNRKN